MNSLTIFGRNGNESARNSLLVVTNRYRCVGTCWISQLAGSANSASRRYWNGSSSRPFYRYCSRSMALPSANTVMVSDQAAWGSHANPLQRRKTGFDRSHVEPENGA